jgi:DNA-binding MarR family transcriptional regulator
MAESARRRYGPPDPADAHERAVLDVLVAVRAFSDAMDRMHSVMKGDMEMNATDLAAIRMLIMREQDGPVSPHDVARHLRISTASTTKLLDRLEDAGHLVRRPHPTDRRSRVIELTDVSRGEFYRHFGARLRGMRAVAEGFTDAELEASARFISAVAEVFDPPARRSGTDD